MDKTIIQTPTPGKETALGLILATMVKEEVAKAIEEYEAQRPPVAASPKTYTRAQACEMLQCSYPTFHRLVNDGAIEVVKVGRKTLVLADKLEKQIKSGTVGKYVRVKTRRA